ncbi:nucleotidyltransferase domain-containing protein, partial [Pimelobacter simplex]
MRDPGEGVSRGGLIVTGARRDRIPAAYRAVLDDAVALLGDGPGAPSLYVYGSVATGQAEPGRSDVDLLTVGLPRERAAALGAELSDRFAGLGRGVEVACLGAEDLAGRGRRRGRERRGVRQPGVPAPLLRPPRRTGPRSGPPA